MVPHGVPSRGWGVPFVLLVLLSLSCNGQNRTRAPLETPDEAGSCLAPPPSRKERDAANTAILKDLEVEWDLPVGCDFSGFFVEMLGYLPELEKKVGRLLLTSGECSPEMLAKLPQREAQAVQRAQENARGGRSRGRIVIQHSEPCAWKGAAEYSEEERPLAVIGRTMTEVIPSGRQLRALAKCAERADAVWVPTRWHQVVLGEELPFHKLSAVPEAVDAAFFDPALAPARPGGAPFTYIAVFKWEHRKGWDILLDAYWSLFDPSDEVLLKLVAWVPSWERGSTDVARRVEEYARVPSKRRDALWAYGRGTRPGAERPPKKGWYPAHAPRVEVVGGGGGLSREELRGLYASADALVMPTRGEGWGLPAAEAMAMGLGVIATDWSGPTGFVSDRRGYLLRYEEVVSREGATSAEPSATHLMLLMRRVFHKRGEMADKGREARDYVAGALSPRAVVGSMGELLADLVREAGGGGGG